MKALVNLAYSAAVGAVAALVAEDWSVLFTVVGCSVVAYQIARVIPGDSLRVKAMAWYIAPVALALAAWERWGG